MSNSADICGRGKLNLRISLVSVDWANEESWGSIIRRSYGITSSHFNFFWCFRRVWNISIITEEVYALLKNWNDFEAW